MKPNHNVQVAEYVAEMASGMREMANAAGLEALDYILGLVREEAVQIVARAGKKTGASTLPQFDVKPKRRGALADA